jgi:hypothetical protein
LAEKIAAIRERRERHKDMLAKVDQTGEPGLASRPQQPSDGCCIRMLRWATMCRSLSMPNTS